MRNSVLSLMHNELNPLKTLMIEKSLRVGSVLDIGCGNGLYGFVYEKLCAEIMQADIIDRRAKDARKFPFVELDANALSFEANSYDNVIAFDIVEHLEDDIVFFKAIATILKAGGRLLLSVPNEDNSQLKTVNLAHIHYIDKTHRREYSSDSLKKLMEEAGFKILKITPHINSAITNIPMILARENILSRTVAFILAGLFKGCVKTGLFKNNVVADWFVVGEVRK